MSTSAKAKYSALSDAIPKAPTYSDDEIARLIMREYASVRPSTPIALPIVKEINKVYLANTINSVEAHNKREEISECWRQHELDKKLRKRKIVSPASESIDVESSREYWAQRKAIKMAFDNTSGSFASEQPPVVSQTAESDEQKSSKKSSKKHKKHKKEKSSKHKKQKKKEKM